MNQRTSWKLACAALLALGLAGCSTTKMDRIDANRALYESWPLEMQSAVLEGKVVKGMTPDMVRMALGKPTRVETRSGGKTSDEIWIYEQSGGSGMSRPNVAMGGSMGGVGVATGSRRVGGGSRSAGGGVQERQVIFQNGVVSRAD